MTFEEKLDAAMVQAYQLVFRDECICLTRTEKQVIKLRMEGYSVRDITKILNICQGSVKRNIMNGLRKLKVRSMVDLAVVMYLPLNHPLQERIATKL